MTRVLALALAMDIGQAAFLLTMADEPDLLLGPDEPVPMLDPEEVAAARIVSTWTALDFAPPVFH